MNKPNNRPALIVGLGNPGKEYATHRHNVGFQVVDALARAHGLRFSRQKGAKAHVAEGRIAGQRVLLAKPQTFMNLSGQAVGRLAAATTSRPSASWSSTTTWTCRWAACACAPRAARAGTRACAPSSTCWAPRRFPRLRVGIDRPPGRMDPADYVLLPFDGEQRPIAARDGDAGRGSRRVLAGRGHRGRHGPLQPATFWPPSPNCRRTTRESFRTCCPSSIRPRPTRPGSPPSSRAPPTRPAGSGRHLGGAPLPGGRPVPTAGPAHRPAHHPRRAGHPVDRATARLDRLDGHLSPSPNRMPCPTSACPGRGRRSATG